MGLLTLANFRTQIEDELNRSSVGNTKLDRWLNAAYLEVLHGFKFHELEGSQTFLTVDGTHTYAIGATLAIDISDFRALHDEGLWVQSPTDNIKQILPETRDSWLEKIDLDIASTAEPTHFHKFGDTIYLRPVPDTTILTILVHYWKSGVKLAADGDVTILDSDWDDILAVGAIARGFRNFGEESRKVNARNEFLSMIRTRSLEIDVEPFPEGGISLPAPTDTEAVLS